MLNINMEKLFLSILMQKIAYIMKRDGAEIIHTSFLQRLSACESFDSLLELFFIICFLQLTKAFLTGASSHLNRLNSLRTSRTIVASI